MGAAVADLVIRGGTVVTAAASRRADIAIDGGVITAIEPDLSGPAAAAEVIDATEMLVLPGVVDVHTHTRGPPRRLRYQAGGVPASWVVPVVGLCH